MDVEKKVSVNDNCEKFLNCKIFRDEVLKIIYEFRNAVALPEEPLGLTKIAKLNIKLKYSDIRPICMRPYKIPHAKEKFVNAEVRKMLNQGVVSSTISAWSFPIVVVTKPGTNPIEQRLCVDLRKLNEVIEDYAFPLPNIDDLLNSVRGCKWYSTVDVCSAFH